MRGEAVQPIDRHALVARHQPVLRQFDPENPLSVGNGEFAFTADVTGLQTFPEAFTNTIPLREAAQKLPKIKVLSIAGLLGAAIESIHMETSVSSLFN